VSVAKKVVITDFVGEPLEVERGVLDGVAEVVALEARDESELAGRVEDADALMVYHFLQIGAATIARLEKCQLIVRCGAGFDAVDGAAARARGISLANVPDYGTEEVADSAIAMTLSMVRGIHLLNSRLQRGEGDWTYEHAKPLRRLRTMVFGIVGIGEIGSAAAVRAKALGFSVVAYDSYVEQERFAELGVERADTLDQLLAAADVVSLHCPLTDETRRMIDGEALSKMKRGSFFVNTARGGVMDAEAVLEAVRDGRLAGAGLDVLETEPPERGDPLIAAWRNEEDPAHDRIIICPHAAFYSEESIVDMRRKGSENCRRILEGEEPINVVN